MRKCIVVGLPKQLISSAIISLIDNGTPMPLIRPVGGKYRNIRIFAPRDYRITVDVRVQSPLHDISFLEIRVDAATYQDIAPTWQLLGRRLRRFARRHRPLMQDISSRI